MGYSLGRNVFAVDTHVTRVLSRVGVIEVPAGKPKHGDIEELVPARIRVRFHMNLVHHGRAVCRWQRPLCEVCCLAGRCDFAGRQCAGTAK
jgi:endonuclease III